MPAMQETRFDPWVQKIPWRRIWQPTLVRLPGKSHGQRSLADHSLWGHKSWTWLNNWTTTTTTVTYCLFLNVRIIIFSYNLLTGKAISPYSLKLINSSLYSWDESSHGMFCIFFLYPERFTGREPVVDLWFFFLKLLTGYSYQGYSLLRNELRSALPFLFFPRFCIKLKICLECLTKFCGEA